jgi:hypothetical protein
LGGLRFNSRFKGAGDESQFNSVHTKANSPFDKNCLRVASLPDSKDFLLIVNIAGQSLYTNSLKSASAVIGVLYLPFLQRFFHLFKNSIDGGDKMDSYGFAVVEPVGPRKTVSMGIG